MHYPARVHTDFRAALTAALAQHGWNYSDLGRASGINGSVISRWFATPPRRPTPANLEKLAPALGVDYEDLMRSCGYLPGETNLPDDEHPELVEVGAAWPRISEGVRQAILILARSGFSGKLSQESDSTSHYIYQEPVDRRLVNPLKRTRLGSTHAYAQAF